VRAWRGPPSPGCRHPRPWSREGGTALTAQPLAALGGLGGGRRSDHRSAVRDFWLDITAPPRQTPSRYGAGPRDSRVDRVAPRGTPPATGQGEARGHDQPEWDASNDLSVHAHDSSVRTANGGLPARWPRCARPPVSGETTADGGVRRRKRVVIADRALTTAGRCTDSHVARRFHGPSIDIEGAARLGVRHATADHPRELLPSTIAACSGVVTFPRTRPVTTWLAETGHRPPGRGPVVAPPPVRGGSGQRVTVGGPSRRRPTTVRAVAARMRCPGGPPGRCACWSAGDSRGGTAGDTQRPPIGTKIKIPR